MMEDVTGERFDTLCSCLNDPPDILDWGIWQGCCQQLLDDIEHDTAKVQLDVLASGSQRQDADWGCTLHASLFVDLSSQLVTTCLTLQQYLLLPLNPLENVILSDLWRSSRNKESLHFRRPEEEFLWSSVRLFIGSLWMLHRLDSFYIEVPNWNQGVVHENLTAKLVFALGKQLVAASNRLFACFEFFKDPVAHGVRPAMILYGFEATEYSLEHMRPTDWKLDVHNTPRALFDLQDHLHTRMKNTLSYFRHVHKQIRNQYVDGTARSCKLSTIPEFIKVARKEGSKCLPRCFMIIHSPKSGHLSAQPWPEQGRGGVYRLVELFTKTSSLSKPQTV